MILNRYELLKCQNGPSCLETIEVSVKMSANKIEFMSMIHLFETLCLVFFLIITGRNEVVAKVMFLHVSVILFTGGGVSRQGEPPAPRQGEPPQPGRPPPDQADPPSRENPPDQADPPNQADPPGPGRPPPDQAPSPGKQTSEYGLRAAGTHPTRMHSCFFYRIGKKRNSIPFAW